MRCLSCGFENPEGMNFCGKCGTPLTGQTTAPKPALTEEAERRQLTVMFCDLVGSTTLAEQLDPEELRDVIGAYQEVCGEVIHQFDGYIAQYLGDGILVYFGYPMAHEDDAQRAVRTGLGILAAIERLNTHCHRDKDSKLAVRLGIHTGLVVVGETRGGEKRERIALGDTPNIAFRLQEIAQPNTLIISSVTNQLIHGYFECRDLGIHTFKGIAYPVQVYRVIDERRIRSHFEASVGMSLTPLVGREREIGILLDRWERGKKGRGQVAVLVGEPGIGKSRLLRELRQHVASETHVWLKCRCMPYYRNSAFYPVIDLLERSLEFRREDSSQAKLMKLETGLSQYRFVLEDTVPLFAFLLSLPLPESYPPLNLTPQRQKEKTQEALLAWLIKIAENQPVLFVVEDLHWADPSTLELLDLLVDQEHKAPNLTVLTFRPEFSPPWAIRATEVTIGWSHLINLILTRLDRKEVEVMIENVAGDKALPAEVVQQIIVKTDGVPLFVEELTKMVIESGFLREKNGKYMLIAPLPTLAIPTTLQDSLMARLDRLTTARGVAQLGAIIGREFTYELIQAVSPLDEATLRRELTRLVEAEFLYQQGLIPKAKYLFKHALIQETAYKSLLKSTRRRYHQRIAQALEEQFTEIVETQPELLAHHYTEGGLKEEAITYWQKAGQKAIERSANIEAISHLTKGLESLKILPDTPERNRKELSLQTILGPALIVTKGYAAPEVKETYVRARELCQQLGETPQLFPVLTGLWSFYMMRAQLQVAYELAEQLLRLAQSLQDPISFLLARQMIGITLFYLGEFTSARVYLEQSISIYYHTQRHRSYALLYNVDSGVNSLSFVTLTLWLVGYPDQALKRIHEALALAQELNHPYSLAFARLFAARLHHFRQEWQLAKEWADALISLSNNQEFTLLLTIGTILRTGILAGQEQKEERITEMRRGLAAWETKGAELGRPYHLALLAEVYRKGGQNKEALSTIDNALTEMEKTRERWYEAEIYRLRGELLLAFSPENQSEAETCFRRAISIAGRQGAKSWELRVVMSLGRLLQKQGKKEEASEMLSGTYGWFTEGFDTRDLKDAVALIEDLS
ncbi:MAG: AAA family ATPase [Ignavibacteriales bacterium]